ncbi:hypothetical protein V7S76_05475 [Aquirufa sp. ROCK2-A2]
MEKLIQNLIYFHAFFGAIGLITGALSIIVKKGANVHRKTGRIFSYSMIISSIISLVIAQMPNHENTFLFSIGIFTIYLVLSGNRALTFQSKIKTGAEIVDKIISGGMFLISLIMITLGILGIIQAIGFSVLYAFFGGFGLFLSVNDFRNFHKHHQNKKSWLAIHIGRMVGAYIATTTAFLVVALQTNSLFFWISPTIVGTTGIIYWIRKSQK